MIISGRIRRSKPSMLDHFKFLKSVAKKTPKFTMPSPRCCTRAPTARR